MDTETQLTADSPEAYVNRELSWLAFARRVLALAEDEATPLLERVKFAGIMGMLYDEFAMKRIGGLRRRIEKQSPRVSPDGLTPAEELRLCREELHRQSARLSGVVQGSLRPAMAGAGLALLDWGQLDEAQRSHAEAYFRESVEPALTPLAVDAGHPFPFISNLSLNLGVVLHAPGSGRRRFVRIKVPPNRPRWIPLPGGGFVPLEQVIAANVGKLFNGPSRSTCHFFRVNRGAKDDPWERTPLDESEAELTPGSLIGMVTAELSARRFAGVVRLQVSADMPEDLQQWIAGHLAADPADIERMDCPLGLSDLMKLPVEGHPALRDPPHRPVTHPRLRYRDPNDWDFIFREIRRGDLLLHHPYHSFDTSVLRFLESAARDPKVLAIKLTIYRTASQSPIILALMEAVRRGKQVAVLVEITARFDEAPNIAWGEQLEKAGAHVVYGVERLKTHVKLALVVREEGDGIRRYVHVATGNYHTGTARLYEDLGLLSCDPELGAGAAAVFNELTGGIAASGYGPLVVAPHGLREHFVGLIRREAEHARAGRASGIRAKMNQLQDPAIIRELYLAAAAGVPMRLNVRGLCCLRAGVPGLSESVQVYSTLGRFLEHGRIYRFENAGEPEFYLGSADWMRRNLESRVETITRVKDPAVCRELEAILDVYDADNATAWDMQPDGSYLRRRPGEGEASRGAQDRFIARAAGEEGRPEGEAAGKTAAARPS